MRRTRLMAIAALLFSTACGFEVFLGLATGDDHPVPDAGTTEEPKPAVVTGTVPAASIPDLDARDLEFLSGSGAALSPAVSVSGEQFTATFPAGERFVGMVVAAGRGTVALRALVPAAPDGETTQAGDFDGIDNRETAACLLLEAQASAAGRSLSSYPADTLQVALDDVAQLSASGVVKTLYDMVQAVCACTDCKRGSAPRFRAPVVTATGLAIQSAMHPDFILANPIDYDGDQQDEDTTEKFDAAMAAALGAFEFKACYCDEQSYYVDCGYDRPMIQAVFAVDFNQGTKDGNCDPIDRFLWAEDQSGAKMFFAAGLHPDSPVTDETYNQLLGAWVPNKIPMYDDGTHGDDKAGDSVWTVSFVLPVGTRIGYKYTWGLSGDNWGGTEEWPGNRRLMEVVDVNEDHIVARYDNFADEATNKDVMNRLLPKNGGTGLVDWETDANKDGIPDARERMIDTNPTDENCSLDTWWTPTGVLALTTPCP
jgi:hypothetical protein